MSEPATAAAASTETATATATTGKRGHLETGGTPKPPGKEHRAHGDEPIRQPFQDDDLDMSAEQDAMEELWKMAVTAQTQASFLLAKHADAMRDKARLEFIVGGWTKFTPDAGTAEARGIQLEAQAESRERAIKELAKKAGVTRHYYSNWAFSHQTKPDELSLITVVTVQQPWQKTKMTVWAKENKDTGKLEERFYIDDWEETQWDKTVKCFGKVADSKTGLQTLKIQPQISLWDRITGIPLKVAMTVSDTFHLQFRHSWRDHTLVDRNTGEYLCWIHFEPAEGKCTVHLSMKNTDFQAFKKAFISKFDDFLNNTSGKGGKGKGTAQSSGGQTRSENDVLSMPFLHSSHSKYAKYPFIFCFNFMEDGADHWGTWKTAWRAAVNKASTPFTIRAQR